MATYRQIHVKFWADEKIEELSPLAMLTFIYLFSNSHRNEAALYHLTIKKISNETNQSPEQVKASLEELISYDLLAYDSENNIVWVKNSLKYQSINPKCIIAIKKDIAGINSPLVKEFTEYYKELIDTHSIPIRYPIDTHAGNDKGKGNDKGNDKDKKDIPPKSPKKNKTSEPKAKHADFVSLTNAEYSALVAKLGDEDKVKRCIEILDNYKGANGKRYLSDYRAILNWVVARLEEEELKGGQAHGREPTGDSDPLAYKKTSYYRNLPRGPGPGVQ